MLPQASGVAMARTPRMTGAFHGAMPSTTPAGWRTPIASEPGHVGRDHLAGDLRGQRRGLAQHARRQHHVEAGPHAGGAGLGCHRLDELRQLGLERVGGLEQQRAALARARSRSRSGRPRRRLRPPSPRRPAKRPARAVATVPSSGLRRSKVAPFSAVTFRPLISMDRSDMGAPWTAGKMSVQAGCGARRAAAAWRRGRGAAGTQVGLADDAASAPAAWPGRWPPACRAPARSRGRRRPAPSCTFCSTISTVVPASAMRRAMASSSSTMRGARPSEGSSSISRRGALIMARATATICCSPPLMVPASWPRAFAQLREVGEAPAPGAARARPWAPASRRAPGSRRPSSAGTAAGLRPPAPRRCARSRGSCCGSSSPSSSTSPWRGIRPLRARSSVVLPAPLGPRMTVRPGCTSKRQVAQHEERRRSRRSGRAPSGAPAAARAELEGAVAPVHHAIASPSSTISSPR